MPDNNHQTTGSNISNILPATCNIDTYTLIMTFRDPHLTASIRVKVGVHFNGKFIHKWHTELCFGERVSVPGLLMYLQCRLRGNVTKPAREVAPNMIDLGVCYMCRSVGGRGWLHGGVGEGLVA